MGLNTFVCNALRRDACNNRITYLKGEQYAAIFSHFTQKQKLPQFYGDAHKTHIYLYTKQ